MVETEEGTSRSRYESRFHFVSDSCSFGSIIAGVVLWTTHKFQSLIGQSKLAEPGRLIFVWVDGTFSDKKTHLFGLIRQSKLAEWDRLIFAWVDGTLSDK